jgi:hypothetical protein
MGFRSAWAIDQFDDGAEGIEIQAVPISRKTIL